jgi:tetrahydromethanopterin S-methyltransferase subunit G
MEKLQFLWDYETKVFGELVGRELLFGIFVGVSEGVIIYLVLGAFGMFDTVAIYK